MTMGQSAKECGLPKNRDADLQKSYLFVLGHPAHVHLFRNAIRELREHGHVVHIGAIQKESTLRMLSLYHLDFEVVGRNVPSLVQKVLDLPHKDVRLLRLISRIQPDVVVSTGSPYAAQAAKLHGSPHIAFSDTEIATAIIRMMLPFTDAVCTPDCFWLDLGDKQVRYAGYHELAYLHPARFQPRPDVLDLVEASAGERIILVRFASWDSSHDLRLGRDSFRSQSTVVSFVERLEQLGRVLITSERPVPEQLEDRLLRIPPDRMHDLLSVADLYVGEGATMASEAGVLGTPWIFVSQQSRGYLDDQESRYGLGFHVDTPEKALERARNILSGRDTKARWQAKRSLLLKAKIDVTGFIVRLLEDWPHRSDLPPVVTADVGRG